MPIKQKSFRKIYLLLFFILLYLPVLSVVLYSFNNSSSTAKWTGFTLAWYKELFNDGVIGESFRISIQVALLTAIVSAIFGTAAAIISLIVTKKMDKTIRGLMILPLLVPEVALGISLLIFFTSFKLPFGRLKFYHILYFVCHIFT